MPPDSDDTVSLDGGTDFYVTFKSMSPSLQDIKLRIGVLIMLCDIEPDKRWASPVRPSPSHQGGKYHGL